MKVKPHIIIIFILLSVILVFTGYQYYSLAKKFYDTEMSRGGKGYVSDEVWYVSSARNILNKVFKLQPRVNNSVYGVSIVYQKSIINTSYVKKLINEHGFNIKLVDTRYNEINVLYLESTDMEQLNRLIYILKETNGVNDVVWGWRLADARNINNYLNLEHPPMVKYLITLSMMIFGDNPLSWRIPSIIAGLLTVFFTFLACVALTKNYWISLIAALLTGIDPVLRILASIALLDIYVALFTSIALYFLFKKKYLVAMIIVLIGSLFKFNVLFMLIPVMALLIRRKLLVKPHPSTLIFSSLKYFVLITIIFLSLQIMVSIPFIMYNGFNWWFENAIFGAIRWHTTIKCVGSGCPISSAPWDWFVGNNGFSIYYFSARNSVVALGFWPLWSIALAYSILFLPYYRFDYRIRFSLLVFYGVFVGYILLFIIGGRTQYSFYSVQFTPLIYIYLLCSFTYIMLKPDRLRKVVFLWNKILYKFWRILIKEVFLINPSFGKT